MDESYGAKAEPRQVTVVERIESLKDAINQKDLELEKVHARLRRLEDRVDSILGSEPPEVETAPYSRTTRGYGV